MAERHRNETRRMEDRRGSMSDNELRDRIAEVIEESHKSADYLMREADRTESGDGQ